MERQCRTHTSRVMLKPPLRPWFPGKASAHNSGDPGLIPGSGRSPGEGNSNPLQYSCCLENSMDGGAWWATVHGVAKSRTRLSDFTSRTKETQRENFIFNSFSCPILKYKLYFIITISVFGEYSSHLSVSVTTRLSNSQGNANQNHNEVSLHTCQNDNQKDNK